jgi:hypothetical protein
MKYLGPPQSGSQAGTTASHNRAGQYYRNRRSPVQPVGTGRRAFIRSTFGNMSKAWSAISPAQQAAWSAYAESYPRTDSLGQSIKLTGQQMFVACNTSLMNAGLSQLNDPPVSNAVTPVGIITFSATNTGTPALNLTLDGAGAATDKITISFARQVSSGVSFVKTFWQADVADANDDTPITGLLALYTAQFGALVSGKKLFLRLAPVNQYGVTGTPTITSVVVG